MAAEIRRADPADATALAADMREADRAEALAVTGYAPLHAATRSIRVSWPHVWAGSVDGELLAVFGVRSAGLLSDTGVPWLLSTNAVDRHWRPFLRFSRVLLANWSEAFPVLENWVDARHDVAIRWLDWLGFEIEAPRPYGVYGLPFHRFTMEAR